MRKRKLVTVALALVALAGAGPAAAASSLNGEPAPAVNGYLEETLTAQSYSWGHQSGLLSHLRLKVDWPLQDWASARGEFDLNAQGTSPSAQNAAVRTSAGVDRLYLRLASGDTQLTVGRQRISWGNGTAFAPADFFNPPNPLDPEGPRRGADGILVRRALGALGYVAAAAAYVDPGDSLPQEVTHSVRLGTHAGHTDLDVGWGRDGAAGRTVAFLEARGDLGVGWHASLARLDQDGAEKWSGAAGVDYSYLDGQLIGTLEYAAGPTPGDSRELPRWAVGAAYRPTELTSYQLSLFLDTDPQARPYATAGFTQTLSDSLDLSLRLAAPLGEAKTQEDVLRGTGELKLRYSF